MTLPNPDKRTPVLPLDIAVDLAVGYSLMQDPDSTTDPMENVRVSKRLGVYQSMALAGADHRDAMKLFDDYSLDATHRKCLKLIYEQTPIWCKSFVASELMNAVKSTQGANRTVVADMIYRLTNGDLDESNNSDEVLKMIVFDSDDAKL